VFQQSISKVQDSIQQISKLSTGLSTGCGKLFSRFRNAVLTSTYANGFDRGGTLSSLEPIKGSERALKRMARSVAIVIGIALSMQSTAVGQGSIKPYQSIRLLADYQLTEVQEKCHNDIVYRESRFKRYAVNGSHHGYYQGRSKYLKGKPDDVQFYWYWRYVSYRYGITEYDEPDYCKALHHLRVKGWQ
jgi:hypothetical protein